MSYARPFSNLGKPQKERARRVVSGAVWHGMMQGKLQALPQLRRESRFVRQAKRPYIPASDCRHLCGSGSPTAVHSLAAANDRFYTRNLYSPADLSSGLRPSQLRARVDGGGDRSCGIVPGKIISGVGAGHSDKAR